MYPHAALYLRYYNQLCQKSRSIINFVLERSVVRKMDRKYAKPVQKKIVFVHCLLSNITECNGNGNIVGKSSNFFFSKTVDKIHKLW
jgi:hypothetical protein